MSKLTQDLIPCLKNYKHFQKTVQKCQKLMFST